MASSRLHYALALMIYSICVPATLLAQPSPPPKKPPAEAPAEVLTKAKTVIVVYARGNTIPFDVIESTLEGWVRFTTVHVMDKADLIVEVGTTGGNSDTRVTASDEPSMLAGRHERSSSTSKDLSNTEITMTVYEPKTRRILWTAKETAKSALKQTARENNLVEAAERLASKFHDQLEPPRPRDQD
jgi:hypothetical protein